uniref:VWFA domain-containing protein n=1 Tax=Oncorhynchus mykiss TaxID=8022 RepID=A0A8K9UY42_ONCMY
MHKKPCGLDTCTEFHWLTTILFPSQSARKRLWPTSSSWWTVHGASAQRTSNRFTSSCTRWSTALTWPPTRCCLNATLADIVFLVDGSSSISKDNFQEVRRFLHSFIEGLDIGADKVHIGLAQFSNEIQKQFHLGEHMDQRALLEHVDGLVQLEGGTATGKAITVLREEFFTKANGSRADQRVPQIAVVLTDGILPHRHGLTYTGEALEYAREKMFIKEMGSRKEQGVQQVAIVITGKSQDNVTSHAAALRRAGVTVYAVGIKDADENELRQIASDPPNKHVLHVDSYAKLKTLEKSLKRSVYDTSAFFSLLILGCLQTDEADMFFLIDHSGSIEQLDFADMKTFINKFINTFHIGPYHIRVGVVKFSDTPALEFDLTTYPDKPSVEKAVDGIIQLGGGTKTGLALNSMGPHFDRAKATRSHKVREYLIVITDGESEDNVKDQAAKLRAQGITIYAIGVKLANDTQLLEIAGSQERKFFERVYSERDFDALKALDSQLALAICDPERGECHLFHETLLKSNNEFTFLRF